jgi:hypothetical protein
MSYPLLSITVTDEHGTDYTPFFADLDLDEFDLIGSIGITAVDAEIPNVPVSPRANVDGPLGALIEAWIASQTRRTHATFGWQYVDANDIHTIAWEEQGQISFLNIHGYSADGRRAYRLRTIARALGLLVEAHIA